MNTEDDIEPDAVTHEPEFTTGERITEDVFADIDHTLHLETLAKDREEGNLDGDPVQLFVSIAEDLSSARYGLLPESPSTSFDIDLFGHFPEMQDARLEPVGFLDEILSTVPAGYGTRERWWQLSRTYSDAGPELRFAVDARGEPRGNREEVHLAAARKVLMRAHIQASRCTWEQMLRDDLLDVDHDFTHDRVADLFQILDSDGPWTLRWGSSDGEEELVAWRPVEPDARHPQVRNNTTAEDD